MHLLQYEVSCALINSYLALDALKQTVSYLLSAKSQAKLINPPRHLGATQESVVQYQGHSYAEAAPGKHAV